jgi:hypothetical protein
LARYAVEPVIRTTVWELAEETRPAATRPAVIRECVFILS